MQYFIGLSFKQNHVHYQMIDSFCQRFDDKYNRAPFVQMTLLPPFFFERSFQNEIPILVDELEETLEGHFLGLESSLLVNFKGLDFKSGKNNVLYLKPLIPIDIFHAQQSLEESINATGAQFKKHKNFAHDVNNELQTFLPICRTSDLIHFSSAIDKARIEFDSPFSLMADNITLFEKIPGQWIARKVLYQFSTDSQNKEHYENDFSLMRTPVNL